MWSWFCVLVCMRAIMFVYDHLVNVQIRAYTNSVVFFFDIDILYTHEVVRTPGYTNKCIR